MKQEMNSKSSIQVKKDYFDLLSRFCRKERAAEQSLSYYAQQIESGHFSKKAGAHCRYCAFENACKEKGSRLRHESDERTASSD
ncbi:hypothetical protein JCM14450A_05340 [Geobacillus stearothermophilus]